MKKFDRAKETTKAIETYEDIIDISGKLQVDRNITIGLAKDRTDPLVFMESPDIYSDTDPRTENDPKVNIGPELTEIMEFLLK